MPLYDGGHSTIYTLGYHCEGTMAFKSLSGRCAHWGFRTVRETGLAGMNLLSHVLQKGIARAGFTGNQHLHTGPTAIVQT